MCRHVARLGVRVRTEAKLDDVRGLFGSCQVVTLFSHAPFPRFEVADLLKPAEIAAKLEQARQAVPRTPADIFLRAAAQEWQVYAARNELAPQRLDKNGLREALCSCFNALIKRDQRAVFFRPGKDAPPGGQDAAAQPAPQEAHGEPLVRFSRPAFEIVFPTEVETRPLVDFADGARSVRDLCRADKDAPLGDGKSLIPAGFRGVADLSICHSAVLSELLKGKDAQRIPCVVIVNRPASHIKARALIYRRTIDLLGARDAALNYVEASDLVRKKILSRDEV
jgi:hypothetical protein